MILIAILAALIGYVIGGSIHMLKQISRIEDKLDDADVKQNQNP
jgi:uncharacterized membrane protein YqgA involved in biofilm formation